ncbi:MULTISPECIES: hypothetical protein [unclassified Caballeronia]|uniref:hypothetical protein n=1 Tax=unclassified Caballeronia TaxID=2646786 RepID=UPI0028637AD6|nr:MULTISPECIES: hypothetical protein [unclassified Caballeronia]MDR5753393.1 hypothetical protein [Caballeronia sp. LZ024]MDR5841132.1 hypothetical protein [Caballeronia sp. LZ031]
MDATLRLHIVITERSRPICIVVNGEPPTARRGLPLLAHEVRREVFVHLFWQGRKCGLDLGIGQKRAGVAHLPMSRSRLRRSF